MADDSEDRTIVRWVGDGAEFIKRSLRDLKARARGKRVRELVLLGLKAEEAGIRLRTGPNGPELVIPAEFVGLIGKPGGMSTVQVPSPAPPTPGGQEKGPEGGLDDEHKKGVDELLENLGISFD